MPADSGNWRDSVHEIQERIHKLVLRVVQCTFGVDSALRRAVRLGAREMLEAGAM